MRFSKSDCFALEMTRYSLLQIGSHAHLGGPWIHFDFYRRTVSPDRVVTVIDNLRTADASYSVSATCAMWCDEGDWHRGTCTISALPSNQVTRWMFHCYRTAVEMRIVGLKGELGQIGLGAEIIEALQAAGVRSILDLLKLSEHDAYAIFKNHTYRQAGRVVELEPRVREGAAMDRMRQLVFRMQEYGLRFGDPA